MGAVEIYHRLQASPRVLSLREVGKIMGVSRMTVERLERSAFLKIAHNVTVFGNVFPSPVTGPGDTNQQAPVKGQNHDKRCRHQHCPHGRVG